MADWVMRYLPTMAPELLRYLGVSVEPVPKPDSFEYAVRVFDEMSGDYFFYSIGGSCSPFEFYERLRQEIASRRINGKAEIESRYPEPKPAPVDDVPRRRFSLS